MNYQPPNVDVDILDNPRIISISESQRLPAIIGLGPTKRYVVDEAVVRGTGSIDDLIIYPASGVIATQIAEVPGIRTGLLSAVDIVSNGQLYSIASASVALTGRITWSGLGANVPSTNDTYYVTYEYDVPATQYNPFTTGDKAAIAARYGEENVVDGLLAVAGNLALENNSPQVVLVQASGSTYNEANYKAAIDKLGKKDNIEQIVVVFPADTVTRSQQQSLLTYAFSHVLAMNSMKKERGLMTGSPSEDFTPDGFDEIGDLGTEGSYLYRANALKHPDVVYVVPSKVQRTDMDGNLMELDGNFAAVAIAGLQAAQSKRRTPLHGFNITGLILENEKWEDAEMNVLGAGGCLVLESKGGIITIRDAKTTDGTSADTEEIAVRSVRRLVQRTLRNSLKNQFSNKGLVILPETTTNVSATTRAILQSLVNDGEIFSFGLKDDPMTGEVKISSQQNPIEPRAIDTTCSFKYLYALKWIRVTASTYV